MSSSSAIGNSSSATYAVQLAQSSALQRSLYNLDTAIQNGNVTAAATNLTALMKAFPQYAAPGSGSASSADPVNQAFQALASSLDQKDVNGARSAWSDVKSALSKEGLPAIQNPADTTALLLAQNKASLDQTVLSTLLGAGADTSPTVTALLGGGDGAAAGSSDPLSSLVSNWLSYQANGSATPALPASVTGSQLNAAA